MMSVSEKSCHAQNNIVMMMNSDHGNFRSHKFVKFSARNDARFVVISTFVLRIELYQSENGKMPIFYSTLGVN